MKPTAVLIATVAVIVALPAVAETIYVASNGQDDPTCGSVTNPCRSINQSIRNALRGDRILVGPGFYSRSSEGPADCGQCLILVDKTVVIESLAGPETTLIDVGFGRERGVDISAPGAVFGGHGRGFTVSRAIRDGICTTSESRNVQVIGNVSTFNRDGFDIRGTGHLFQENVARENRSDGFDLAGATTRIRLVTNSAINNDDDGIQVDGFDNLFSGNRVLGNGDSGFLVAGPANTFVDNLVAGNAEGARIRRGVADDDPDPDRQRFDGNIVTINQIGFSIESGGGHVVQRNTIANNGVGVRAGTVVMKLTQNNFHGNSCGVANLNGAPLIAPLNYWGAPSGPGFDPADGVCSGTVNTDPAAAEPWPNPGVLEPFELDRPAPCREPGTGVGVFGEIGPQKPDSGTSSLGPASRDVDWPSAPES